MPPPVDPAPTKSLKHSTAEIGVQTEPICEGPQVKGPSEAGGITPKPSPSPPKSLPPPGRGRARRLRVALINRSPSGAAQVLFCAYVVFARKAISLHGFTTHPVCMMMVSPRFPPSAGLTA